MINYLISKQAEVIEIIYPLPFSVMAAATDSSKSPEFPIHVVQPYPTILKPCWFKYFCSPLHQESLYLAEVFYYVQQ